MNPKLAVLLFVLICVALVALALAGLVGPLAVGLGFAVALATLGVLSRGFRGRAGPKPGD